MCLLELGMEEMHDWRTPAVMKIACCGCIWLCWWRMQQQHRRTTASATPWIMREACNAWATHACCELSSSILSVSVGHETPLFAGVALAAGVQQFLDPCVLVIIFETLHSGCKLFLIPNTGQSHNNGFVCDSCTHCFLFCQAACWCCPDWISGPSLRNHRLAVAILN